MKRKGIIMSFVAVALLLSTTAMANAPQPQLPNYVKALGFNAAVKTLGAYSDEMEIADSDYCTYEFDREGHLISYDQSETIEGAYSFTIYFGPDGLPTHAQSIFINYWTEPDSDGNPPVTTTRHNVRKEQKGNVTMLYIEGLGEGEKEVKVTRDEQGRITEVDDITDGVVNRYRYPVGENVPCYSNGMVAFPQVDMIHGHHVNFPPPQAVPTGIERFENGLWQFEVQYYE